MGAGRWDARAFPGAFARAEVAAGRVVVAASAGGGGGGARGWADGGVGPRQEAADAAAVKWLLGAVHVPVGLRPPVLMSLLLPWVG